MNDATNIFNLYMENASAKQEPQMRIDRQGNKKWWLHGELHHEDAPAIEWTNGTKEWWLHGKRHREDGPAIEWADGSKDWYLHHKRHREDGPAIEWSNGIKMWYLHDKYYNDAETWAQAVLKDKNKPATPDDVQNYLRTIYKKKSLL